MDGMARALGGSATIKWNGKTYELPPLVMRDWATIENECLRRKREAKLEAIASLHGKLPDELWETKFAATFKECEQLSEVPHVEVQQWIETREGVSFTLWLTLSRRYPGEFVLEDMMEIIMLLAEEQVEELIKRRDQANGLDAAGNETGLSEN